MICEIIETTSGTIEYSVWGKGEPILILHGGHSNCQERLFHKGIDLKKFKLITPSRPGYGSTFHNLENTPENTASLFIELLDHLKLDESIIYGVSAGGLTAIAIAGLFPERVKKLILVSAVTKKWMDPADKEYKIAKKIFNPKMEGLSWKMVRKFSAIAPRMLTKSFHSQFSKKKSVEIGEKEIFELVEALKRYRSKEGFLIDMDQHLLDESIIKNILCETLIVHSEYENTVPLDHANFALQNIPNSLLVILKNDWGHLIWIGQDSNNSTKIIFEFLIDS